MDNPLKKRVIHQVSMDNTLNPRIIHRVDNT
jgi:hypothetical protein